ncbi:dCTP pyrophosphatase 1 [Seminavis robusta]|uniref:dCTP pyrophosphatase 1 n=1 Tax=Seminavis robusta TaxID=568900 RepID=A0A9N8DAQ0_9STRA|nr:dCTP pyrophosphatase 1 [Seminavis robusta]|eukprot:Sro37_g023130.1 dCTP pyrophosphatase 1 (280) ;mRNA; r:35669-36614
MNQSPKSVAGNIFGTFPSQDHTPNTKTAVPMTTKVDNDRIHHPRSLIFELTGLVGELACVFLKHVPLDPEPGSSKEASSLETHSNDKEQDDFVISKPTANEEVARSMGKILLKLFELSHSLSIKLGGAIRRKMALNNKKYPAEICRGKAGKYTEYSSITGISKEVGQSTLHENEEDSEQETLSSFLESLESLREDISQFARAREWARYHTPRNLVLALLGELGELAELFQWRGDSSGIESISAKDLDKIGQELADVTIYLLRLSDVCGVDLKCEVEESL